MEWNETKRSNNAECVSNKQNKIELKQNATFKFGDIR